jgi:hypothetical protein
MAANTNPLNQEGPRNLFCPYYRKCLDQAVRLRWPSWSCTECRHQLESEIVSDGILTCSDACPFYTLPRRVQSLEG